MSKVGKTLGLPIVNAKAAGMDIDARIQVATVPPEPSNDPVRAFGSFTADIQAMANWMKGRWPITLMRQVLQVSASGFFRWDACTRHST